eukprot:Phypoly_transcript_13911.p1 GENE.Phypoly_transcript_13911~~Phypoly_transcript_13911.p1  ORF type:complete len:321 (+),score=55.42 Phypoly_transcript_13911:26-964(+)
MTTKPKITVVGSANRDLVVYCPELPRVGETIRGSEFKVNFGGKGANQAVQAARLGAHVTMVTKLGKDTFGDETVKNFEDNGISASTILRTDKAASGVALITVDSHGSNSIVIAAGANDAMTPEEVQQARSSIKGSQIVLCQLEVPLEVTIEALKIAKEENARTVLNVAPILPSMPDALFAHADIVIANETELERLSGSSTDTMEQIETAAKSVIAKKGIKEVIVTLGEKGSVYVNSSTAKHVPLDEVVPKEKVLDTTGAGDSFIGSFAVLLAEGKTVENALRGAHGVAGWSVQRYGTQPSFAHRKDVEKYFK